MNSLLFDSNDVRFFLTKNQIKKSGLLKSTFFNEFKESIEKSAKLSLEFFNKSFSNTEVTNVFNILFDDEEVLLTSNELMLGIYFENYLDMKNKKILKELNKNEKFIFTTDTDWKVLIEIYILSINLNIIWELKSNGLYILKKSLENVTLDKLLEFLQEICNSSKDIWIGVCIYYKFFDIKELISIEQLQGAFIVDSYNNPEVTNLNYPFKDKDDISKYISKEKVWDVLNNWTFYNLGSLKDFVWENKYVKMFVGGDCIFNATKFLATNVLPIKKKVEFHIGIKSKINSIYKVFINDLCKKLFGQSTKHVKIEINKNNQVQLLVYDKNNRKNIIVLVFYIFENKDDIVKKIIDTFQIKNRKVGFYKGELLFHPEAILSWINGCENLYPEIDNKNRIEKIYSIKTIKNIFNQGFSFIRKPKVVEWIDSIENLKKITHLPGESLFVNFIIEKSSEYAFLITTCISILEKNHLKYEKYLDLDYSMFKNKNLQDILLKNVNIKTTKHGWAMSVPKNKLHFSDYILRIINIETSFEDNPYLIFLKEANHKFGPFYKFDVEDKNMYLYNFLRSISLRQLIKNKNTKIHKEILVKTPIKNNKLKVYIKSESAALEKLLKKIGCRKITRDNRLIINKNFKIKSVLELNFPEKGYNFSDPLFLNLILFHDLSIVNNSQ